MTLNVEPLFDPGAVWIISNEEGNKTTLDTLETIAPQGNVYVGVGCLANLDLAAARLSINKSQITDIVLFDCSEKVENFWQDVCPLFKCEDAWKFFGDFGDLMRARKNYYFEYTKQAKKNHPGIPAEKYSSDLCTKYLAKQLSNHNNGISFTSKQTKYSKIRNIFINNKFKFVRLNICDFPKVVSLIDLIKSNGTLDTLYISNILEQLHEEERAAYEEFVNRVPAPIFITSELRLETDPYSTQQVYFQCTPPAYPEAAFLKKLQALRPTAQNSVNDCSVECSLELESNKFSFPIKFSDYFGKTKLGSFVVCTFDDNREDSPSTSAYRLVRKKLNPLLKASFPLCYCDSFFNRSFKEVDVEASEKRVTSRFSYIAEDFEALEKIKLHFKYKFSPESFVASATLKSIRGIGNGSSPSFSL